MTFNGFNLLQHTNGTIFSGQNTETHASHVAGIAGAVGNNSKGISGVNWAVGLMSLKFLDEFGSGSTSEAIEAVQYAKTMRDLWIANPGTKGANIRVLNASFGGGGFLSTLRRCNQPGKQFRDIVCRRGRQHRHRHQYSQQRSRSPLSLELQCTQHHCRCFNQPN